MDEQEIHELFSQLMEDFDSEVAGSFSLHLKPQFYDFGQPNMFLAQWR